jgi:hypothetical protein
MAERRGRFRGPKEKKEEEPVILSRRQRDGE